MAAEFDFSVLMAAVDLSGVVMALLSVAAMLASVYVAKKSIFAVMRIVEPYDDDNKYHNGSRGDYRWD